MYTKDDFKEICSPIQLIQNNPEKYLVPPVVDTLQSTLLAKIGAFAIERGAQRLFLKPSVEDWSFIGADIDWLNSNEQFFSFCPTDKVNSFAPEILLTAFMSNVVTAKREDSTGDIYSPEQSTFILGEDFPEKWPTINWKNKSIQRWIAFK